MKEKIINIIIESLKELNEVDTHKDPELEKPVLNTQIFGDQGCLDSLGLIALISDIESKISDEFGYEIVIASEKAMSQRSSPFKSVQSLANYIETALKEKK